MIIFLDLDGVIHNFIDSHLRELQLDYNDQTIRNGLKNSYTYIDDLVGSEKSDQSILDKGAEFWENLKLLPWAHELYDGCVKIAGERNVFFSTSHGRYPYAPNVKVARVKKEFNSDRIILTRHKYLLAGPNRVLVDDKPKNIAEFEAMGGRGYLWPNQFFFLDGDFDINIWLKKFFKKLLTYSNESSKT